MSRPRLVMRGRSPDGFDCTVCGAHSDRPPIGDTLACRGCVDRGYRGEPYVPLTVQMVGPKRLPDLRPILSVCMADRECVFESTGEVFDLEGLVDRLRDRRPGEPGRARLAADALPAAIVTTDDGMGLLAYLDGSRVARSPFWQWQVSLTDMSAWRPEAGSRRRSRSVQPRPMRFGFASRVGKQRRKHGAARWYQLVDVHRFVELPDGWGDMDARRLLRFGIELRDWCNLHRIPVSSSGSGIGSRLLRDARFGAGWRRKVPAATNRRARRMLPGNHYQLITSPDKRIPVAHKWDMRRAHHWAAMTTGFPHPDLLDARGYFRHPPRGAHGRGGIVQGSEMWRRRIVEPGVFIIGVDVQGAGGPLELPQLRRPGRRWVYLTSEEIPYVLSHPNIKLLDIWAAWTSPEPDTRLNEYAWWAQHELDRPGAPRWLKPTLLSAYGLLAARAREFRSAWRWTARTEGELGWWTSHGLLIGLERGPGRPREPRHANVIWRCLIESRVRLEVFRYARELDMAGARVLALYADAVFATLPPDVSPLDPPYPWKYEGVIHDLTFDGPSRYRAREETRLPGTPRGRERLVKAI